MRTLRQNCEQTLQKLRTNRIMNKRAFLRNFKNLKFFNNFRKKYLTFTFGEGTFTFGERAFTFGERTFTFGIIGAFEFFGVSFFCCWGGTPWVGGPHRGFRKYLIYVPFPFLNFTQSIATISRNPSENNSSINYSRAQYFLDGGYMGDALFYHYWCCWVTWVHQNRASPFASDFHRRRGYRREFRSEDHFYGNTRFHRSKNRGSLATFFAQEIAHLGASKSRAIFPGAVKIAAATAENRAILVHSGADASRRSTGKKQYW